MNKDLIVAIYVPKHGGGDKVGTGYPVAENLILTSWHVFDHWNRQGTIGIHWYYGGVENFIEKKELEEKGGREESILAWFPTDDEKGTLDAALIRCPIPESLRAYGSGELSPYRPKTNDRWESSGFAEGSKRSGVRRPDDFRGSLHSMADNSDVFQLDVTAALTNDTDWHGVSGMPVFVDNRIMGIVKQVPENYSGAKLEAVPAWRLLENKGFLEALGRDPVAREKEQRERVECFRQLLEELLEGQDQVVQDLVQAFDSTLAPLEPLARRDQLISLLLDNTPPLETLFNQLFKIQRKQRKRGDEAGVKVIRGLILAILPAIQDAAIIADVRNSKSDPAKALIHLPTQLRTLVEIIMAGVDRREVSLRPLADKSKDFPAGQACLPEPPESGRDADGEQFSQDWKAVLIDSFEKNLDRFKGDFENYLKERFIAREFRSARTQESEQVLLDTIGQELRMEAEDDVEATTYYYIANMPDDEQGQQDRQKILKKLKQQFPHIVFLRLLGRVPLDVEISGYGRLRNLLYEDRDSSS